MNVINDKGKMLDIKTIDLEFDPQNPRFSEEISKSDSNIILEKMVNSERLPELIQSIGLQDYFSGEPLLVTADGNSEGKYYVVEGNRRLAALKMLNGQLKMLDPLPSLREILDSANHKPEVVPCLVFEKRDSILRYLGFKHITGIKSWAPLSKARYLEQLKERFYKDHDEATQLRMLAKEIGSKPYYVGQTLCGLALYDKAKENNFFDFHRFDPDKINFTILTTALGYTNIVDFIGIRNNKSNTLDGLVIDNYRDVFYWLYYPVNRGRPVVSDSRHLKYLAAILGDKSKKALNKLRNDENLQTAYSMTEGPKDALKDLLKDARSKLDAVYTLVPDADDSCFDSSFVSLVEDITKKSKAIFDITKGRIDE